MISQRFTKVIRIYPLGTLNIVVDQQCDIAILTGRTLANFYCPTWLAYQKSNDLTYGDLGLELLV